jgi:hypothetical protein
MKGKTLEKIHLFATLEHHSITLGFQDDTSLALVIEPCLRSKPSIPILSAANRRYERSGFPSTVLPDRGIRRPGGHT